MKLFLIGFSKQNADVLQMLIERLYPDYELVIIERYFGGTLRLQLPKIERLSADTMLIINLDGVGMVNFTAAHIDELKEFIQGKATMLIARHNLDKWKSALPEEIGAYLSVPYSRELMTDALKKLEEKHKKLSEHSYTKENVAPDTPQAQSQAQSQTQEMAQVKEVAEVQESEQIQASLTECGSSYSKIEEDGQFLHKVLSECFAIPKLILLQNILDIRVSNTPIKVKIGNQTFYACPECQVAYVNSINRLIDYCDMLYGLELSASVIVVEPVEAVDFNKLAPVFEKKGYRKYTLNSLLWQICWRLLPNEIDVPDHNLMLKMRYMPNFLQMKKIPEYIRPLIASCLTVPRSTKELIALVQGDETMKGQINHLMLIAILSGAADTEVLRQSYENQAIDKVKKEDNEGIKTAKKTGFLSRLLSKLSF